MSQFIENIDYDLFNKDQITHKGSQHPREIFHWINIYADSSLGTISDVSEYVNKQGVNLCGAVHEKIDNVKLVNDCETRTKSCSCLHGFDFRRFYNGNYKLGDDVFGVKFFAIAYILFQQTKDIDWYIENKELKILQSDMKANDNWPIVYMPKLKAQPRNTKTVDFQRDFGNALHEKYVIPVQKVVSQLIY